MFVMLIGCSSGSDGPAASSGNEAEVPRVEEGEGTGSGALCLPLVSGCGCAYVCAQSMRQIDATRHEVVHDHQDSRVDEAIVERRCFDAAGNAYPEQGAPREATNCRDVFSDNTPCGGECVPSTQYLNCHDENGRCVP
jgi:hypothetical protein